MTANNPDDLAGALGSLGSNQTPETGKGREAQDVFQDGLEGVGRPRVQATPFPVYDDEDRGVVGKSMSDGDDRFQVIDTRPSPYHALCHLSIAYTGGSGTGTGFLVNSGFVATAGHVIWHPDLGLAEEIVVVPARRQEGYTKWQVARRQDGQLHTCRDWGTVAFRAMYDYGAIVLADREMFEPFGTLNLTVLNDGQIQKLISDNYPCTVAGYPAKAPGDAEAPIGSLWAGRGRLLQQGASKTLRHAVDTSEGQSGAPFYIRDGGQYWAVGIHSKKANDGGGNVAHRITDDVVRDFENWQESNLIS
jgi:V8-like Glu-specific endopeptidase